MTRGRRRRRRSDPAKWVWEFSKRLVFVCSVLYIFGFFYACIAMWKFFDFTYLGTFIEQSSDILKTCVFGYFVKAGIENVYKIKGSNSKTNTELTPPDGED